MDGPRWSRTDPRVNVQHVFCGEIKRGRAKGFHSRPGGTNPSTVKGFTVSQEPNAKGIYGGTVELEIHGTPATKFSTLFPDACKMEEVVKSIGHAARNPEPCPRGAPHWAVCGFNMPVQGEEGYCMADDGSRFVIAMGLTRRGVNTAFPLR